MLISAGIGRRCRSGRVAVGSSYRRPISWPSSWMLQSLASGSRERRVGRRVSGMEFNSRAVLILWNESPPALHRHLVVPHWGPMPDRSDEFRKAAADCVALARTTSDPVMRTSLLTMAQKWYDLANGSATNFNAIVREFNDRQMSRPVMQQQQQQQPQAKSKKGRVGPHGADF